VAEATEIIAVVRIGVSLVEHIYKVFAHIFEDSGLSEADLLGNQLNLAMENILLLSLY